MKTLYTLLSNFASLVLGYAFVANLKYSLEFSSILFMVMLIILFFISVILSILSFSKRTKSRALFYNSYSDRRIKNQDFDKHYSFLQE